MVCHLRMGRPFCIERAVDLDASAAEVFAVVNDLTRWSEWSPWARMDPGAVNTLSGPHAGVGATLEWKGKKSGAGRMEMVESAPSERVRVRLDFHAPFKATHEIHWTLAPRPGGGTRMTWTMTGERPWPLVLLAGLLRLDKTMEGQFDEGLGYLKSLVERA
jgi:hypothetical protein